MSVLHYSRYLRAKATVDKRALNPTVRNAFVDALNAMPSSRPLRVIELGAGTGNNVFDLLAKLAHPEIVYYAIDISHEHLFVFQKNVIQWAEHNQFEVESSEPLRVITDATTFEFHSVEADIIDFLEAWQSNSCEAIIAQAVLDLFDYQELMPLLLDHLVEGGCLYCPITFDGMTTFIPAFESGTDELIEKVYHNSMGYDGERARSQTGRNLLAYFLLKGIEVEAVGSSDWIVIPDCNRSYTADEKHFLDTILSCVEHELSKSNQINNKLARRWVTFRRNQLNNGQLIYLAHQLDLLARK